MQQDGMQFAIGQSCAHVHMTQTLQIPTPVMRHNPVSIPGAIGW